MGGDRAPAEVVAGALQAVQDLGIPVLLVGDGAYLESLGPQAGVDILATTEVIEMDEDPAGGAAENRQDGAHILRSRRPGIAQKFERTSPAFFPAVIQKDDQV